MSTRPQELNKIIADLRQIIVGKVAMPTDQIEQITLFLFLKKLSKKHDELVRIGSKELIFTGVWERYHFDVLMRHSGEDLVKECREAVESLYKNPHIDPTVRKVFERSYLKILEPKVLSSFLQYLNDKFSDGLDLGDFYESLLPILGTQNELGQFRTPRHIIDFIVKVIDPNIGEKIADPACGTAGFLVSAFNYLKDKYTEKGRLTLNPEQTKQLYNETIFGWDMEPLMVKFSLANLYLHGLKVPNVSENDTLLNENLWQHTFDIIVANPPFITPKGGAKRHSRFAIKSNKTEVLFCEWIVNNLNFNGRMGVIVPEGIIYDASMGHQEVRKLFLDNGLWCVVSLPPAVFQPYSGINTSIVFLDKTLKPKNILFYKIRNHGFSLTSNPVPIDKNDLPQALEIINDYKKQLQGNDQQQLTNQQYVTVPKIALIEHSTKNLSSDIYQKSKSGNSRWKMVELSSVFLEIKNGKNVIQSDKVGKYKVSRIQTIAHGVVDLIKTKYTNTEVNENDFLQDGDILFSHINSIDHLAKTAIFENITEKVVHGINLLRLRADKNKILPKYAIYIFKSNEFIQNARKYAQKAVNQASINTGAIKTLQIPLPPLDIQAQIVAEIENYQQKICGYEKEIELLNGKIEEKVKSIWES